MIPCEGQSSLLGALAWLADLPEFEFRPDRGDRHAAGAAVAAELQRRARAAGSPVLVILDNVTDPGMLLAGEQVRRVVNDSDLIRWLATSRLDVAGIGGSAVPVRGIAVPELPVTAGVELIRHYQPVRAGGRTGDFADAAAEQAAAEVVGLLGGFTLALEQVAIHFGAQPGTHPVPAAGRPARGRAGGVGHCGGSTRRPG